MKRMYSVIYLLLHSAIHFGQGTGFVTLQGRQFKDENGNDFYPVIMNYSISMTYNTYPPTQVNHVDINPHPHNGSYITFEHAAGALAVYNDFEEISDLGFNTIRLSTGLRRYNSPLNNQGYVSPCKGIINGTLFTFDWFIHSYHTNPNINAGGNACFAIQPPYSSNPSVNLNMYLYLVKLEEAIMLAEQAGLRVILLTGDGFELFNGNGLPINHPDYISNQDAVNDYEAFLEVLTAYFAGNTTIMAYDLSNEPSYKDGDHNLWNRSKNDICDYISQLYDAIKQPNVHPNHLITIGLGDVGTIQTWDPEVMKTDFVSLHFYPMPQWGYDFSINPQTTVMQNAVNRLNDQIYWATKYLQRPWILGETGFTSTPPYNGADDWNCYGINGTYADLTNFITNLLPIVKNCGASGLAWWNFQDSFDSDSPNGLPCNPALNFNYREKCWGLIKKGDPLNGDYTAAGLEKIAQPTPFETFNWLGATGPCTITPPATYDATHHYYDPYLNNTYNPSHTGAIEGYVTDAATGLPIEGALVLGYCWLYTNTTIIPFEYYHYWNSTFTDINGYYKVIPFNYHPSNFGFNQTTLVRVMAPGSNLNGADRGGWDDVQLTPSTQNFSLQRINFNYDHTIVTTVAQGITKHFKGWNTLLAATTTELNGISDLTAREEINLTGKVHISNTAEVHIYTSPEFNDCPDYTGYRATVSLTEKENGNYSEKEIILSFVDENNFTLLVYPIPNKGIFMLKFTGMAAGSKTTINIKNVIGETIHSISTNLDELSFSNHFLAKGIYFIEAINNQNKSIQKLMIQ
jgi:hypothetical protein